MRIDRRLMLKGATLGLGALAYPGWAQVLEARGFTHSVASGEPGHTSVMLWTRYVSSPGATARLRWEVAHDASFGRVAARGETLASQERDWCVKPVAERLAPGTWYYYRFIDENGRASATGRTRTLPDGPLGLFRIAVFSCANLPYGYFNAYAHAAARDDVDLVVHLGDYLYEYERGRYPTEELAIAGRLILPEHEMVSLADYRLRYASYRADRDLQELHRLFPMVMMWDDHESANDSWVGGAQNHQPDSEGPWGDRKAAAMRACREWLPVSEADWTSYRIGDLADLFRPETRLTGRSRPLILNAAIQGREDLPQAFAEFRDGPWRAQDRTMLGLAQERWLDDGLRRSVGDGVRWQLLGQQVLMGSRSLSADMARLIDGVVAPGESGRTRVGRIASQAGLPMNLDAWDGYPAARARLLASAQEADANLVVLSGDSHNAWAFDLDHDRDPAGVEFAGQSVSSPGLEGSVAADPDALARAFVEGNRQLKWAQTSRRGYFTVRLTPERVTSEWTFLDTVRRPSLTVASRKTLSARRRRNRLDLD